MNIVEAIKKLIDKENLSEDEVRDVINEIMNGEATSCQKGGFLTALKLKGETAQEMLGAVKALRDNFIPVKIQNPKNLIDTCGTGGDGGKTFNVSTAVAIVAASGGAKIAKHGNHAVSSKSGSADVLGELKIKTDYTSYESAEVIINKGMAFLFAPQYNPAMKNVSAERKELGCRTLFNLIGPLSNPAPLTGQLMGIYDGTLIESVGQVLKDLGLNRAMVVHGDDGLDEITTTTTTTVCELNNGVLTKYTLDIIFKISFIELSLNTPTFLISIFSLLLSLNAISPEICLLLFAKTNPIYSGFNIFKYSISISFVIPHILISIIIILHTLTQITNYKLVGFLNFL